jgi:hypothetical protein
MSVVRCQTNKKTMPIGMARRWQDLCRALAVFGPQAAIQIAPEREGRSYEVGKIIGREVVCVKGG